MRVESDSIRVLHVDDEPAFTDLVATFLERESDRIEVTSATDASGGIATLEDTEIDCVVSDFDMPGMDGLEFLERVREEHPDLPFVLFTGKGSEEVASEAISAGVSDYLQKRGGVEQYTVLANRIENLVRRYRAEATVERHAKRRVESEQYHRQLVEITSDAAAGPTRTITRLLKLGCDRLDTDNGHLVKIDQEAGRHEVVSVHGSDIVRKGTTDLATSYCRRTIRSDEILDVHDAAAQGWNDDPAYEKYGLGTYIGKKLLVEDRLFGTVCFVSQHPRDEPFTYSEKAFFDLLCREFNQLLERKRLRSRVDALFEGTQDAMFLVDVIGGGQFRIRRANRAYRELTGHSSDEIRGRRPREVFDDDQGAELDAGCRVCVDRGEPIEFEADRTIDGEPRQWRTKLTPVLEDGDAVQLVGATREVTASRH